MDTVLKNVLISGVAVFFIVGMFAFVQLQNSQAKIEEAEQAAAQLGRDDARETSASGERFLLAAAYGWGPQDIPGFSLDQYNDCLVDHVELRVFWDYTDVYFEPHSGNYYKALIEFPTKTPIYAESFNKEMLTNLGLSAGCRIPLAE